MDDSMHYEFGSELGRYLRDWADKHRGEYEFEFLSGMRHAARLLDAKDKEAK